MAASYKSIMSLKPYLPHLYPSLSPFPNSSTLTVGIPKLLKLYHIMLSTICPLAFNTLVIDDLVHIVQGFAGAVIDICIEQQLHTRSLCSRIEFFKFPIVIDSGTVNFSYMLYYVTFANQIICTFSLVLKSPLVKFARLLSVYL